MNNIICHPYCFKVITNNGESKYSHRLFAKTLFIQSKIDQLRETLRKSFEKKIGQNTNAIQSNNAKIQSNIANIKSTNAKMQKTEKDIIGNKQRITFLHGGKIL